MAGRRKYAVKWLRAVRAPQRLDAGFSLVETVLALSFSTLVAATGISALAEAHRAVTDGLTQSERIQEAWVLQQRLADDMHDAASYSYSGSSLSITDSQGDVYGYRLTNAGLLSRSVNGYGTIVLAIGVSAVTYAELQAGGILARVSFGEGVNAVEQEFIVPFALGPVG